MLARRIAVTHLVVHNGSGSSGRVALLKATPLNVRHATSGPPVSNLTTDSVAFRSLTAVPPPNVGLAVPDEVQPRDSTTPPALEPMFGQARLLIRGVPKQHRRELVRPSRVPDGRSKEMLADLWWYQAWSEPV